MQSLESQRRWKPHFVCKQSWTLGVVAVLMIIPLLFVLKLKKRKNKTY